MFFKNLYFLDQDIPGTETYTLRLSGTVVSGNTALKTIWVYYRDTGELFGTTSVESDGTWSIHIPTIAPEHLLVICRDEGGDYNADTYDRVSQCTDTILTSSEYTAVVFENTANTLLSDILYKKIGSLSNLKTEETVSTIVPVVNNTFTPISKIKGSFIGVSSDTDIAMYQDSKGTFVADHPHCNADIFGDGSQVGYFDATKGFITPGSMSSNFGPHFLKTVRVYNGVRSKEYGRGRANTATIDFVSNWFDWESDYTLCYKIKFTYGYSRGYFIRLLIIHRFFWIGIRNGNVYFYPGNGSNTGYGSEVNLGPISDNVYNSVRTVFLFYAKDSFRLVIDNLFDSGVVSWGPLANAPIYPWSLYSEAITGGNVTFYWLYVFNRHLADSEMNQFLDIQYDGSLNISDIKNSIVSPSAIIPTFIKPKVSLEGTTFYDNYYRVAIGDRAVIPFESFLEFGKESSLVNTIVPLGLSANPARDNSDGGSVGDESALYVAVRFTPKKIGTIQSIVKSGDSQNGIAVGLDTSGHVGVYGRSSGSLTSIISTIVLENHKEYIVVATHSDLTIYDLDLNVLETVSGTLTVADSAKTLSVGQIVGESVISGTTDPETFVGYVSWVSFFDNTPELGTACYKTIAAEYMGQQVNVPIMIEKWRADQDDIRMWVQLPTVYSGQDTYFDLYFSQDNFQNYNVGIQGVDPDLFTVGASYVDHTDVEYSTIDPGTILPGNGLDQYTKLLLRSDAKTSSELLYDGVYQQYLDTVVISHDASLRSVGRTALRFIGANYITCVLSTDFDLTQSWTVKCKFSHSLDSYSGFYALFSEWSNGGSDTLFKFGLNSSGHLAFEVYTTSNQVVDTGVALTKNQIYDLEVSYNGTDTILVFVDGTLEHTESLANPIASRLYPFVVGAIRMVSSTNYDEFWEGTVEEFTFDLGVVRNTSNFTPNSDFKVFEGTGQLYEISPPKPQNALPQMPVKIHLSRSTGPYNVDMRPFIRELLSGIDYVDNLSLLLQAPGHRDEFIYDDSPNTLAIAQFNTTYVNTDNTNFPRAINFNGTDAVLELDATDPTLYLAKEPDTSSYGCVDCTIEAFIKKVSGDYLCIYIIGAPHSDNGSNTAYRQGIRLSADGDDYLHVLAGNYNQEGSSHYLHKVGDITIPDNILTHVALVVKDGLPYMFVNGVLCILSDGTDGGASSFDDCRLYVPRKVNIGSAYLYGGSVDTTLSASWVSWGKGSITNLRLLKGIALWTANFTPPTSEYKGIPLNRVSVYSKVTKKPWYTEIVHFSKEEECLTLIASSEDFGPSDYEFLVNLNDISNYFTGRTGEIAPIKMYDANYVFVQHLQSRYHKGVYGIDSIRKHHCRYTGDPSNYKYNFLYGFYTDFTHGDYLQFEDQSQYIWGGLQGIYVSVMVYDCRRHYSTYQGSYLLSDGVYWWNNISINIQLGASGYAYPICDYAQDSSNYYRVSGTEYSSIFDEGTYYFGVYLSGNSCNFYTTVPNKEYVHVAQNLSGPIKNENNVVRIASAPIGRYGTLSASFLWVSNIERSIDYVNYLKNLLYNPISITVSKYNSDMFLLGWEHADKLRVTIPSGTVASDETDYAVELRLSNNSGSNSFDASDIMSLYSKDIELVSATIKDYKFGFDRDGFAGLYLAYIPPVKDICGNIDTLYPFSDTGHESFIADKNWLHFLAMLPRVSISCWVYSKPKYATEWQNLYSCPWASNYTDYYSVYSYRANQTNFYYRIKPTGQESVLYDTPIGERSANEWTHFVCSYDKPNRLFKVYENGVLVHNNTLIYKRPDNPFGIGGNIFSPYYWFSGFIDNFRMYDFAVDSEEQAVAIMNDKKCFRYKTVHSISVLDFTDLMLNPLKGISLNSYRIQGECQWLLSFDGRTFSIYESGWTSTVSDDSAVHGGTDGNWMVYTHSTWVNCVDRLDALNKAFSIYPNSVSTLNSLTNTEFNLEYDSSIGKCIAACAFTGSIISKPIINDGFLWFSEIYDVEKYIEGSTIQEAKVQWEYLSSDTVEVWVAKSGTTDWVACTNWDDIPGLTVGDDPTGVQIQFRVFVHNKTWDDKKTRVGLQVKLR